jgi:hypothetical protein
MSRTLGLILGGYYQRMRPTNVLS